MTESNQNRNEVELTINEWVEDDQRFRPVKAPRAATMSPILFREILALVLLVALADVTIYRSRGYAGPGVLFLIAPILLCVGTVRWKIDINVWFLVPMLVLVAVRLMWCGSELAVAVGFVVLCSFSMSLNGWRPYVSRVVLFTAHLITVGHRNLNFYLASFPRIGPSIRSASAFAILLPLLTLFAFATIFVMANPDVVKTFSSHMGQFAELFQKWIQKIELFEAVFWGAVAWLVAGMLRPDESPIDSIEAPRTGTTELVKSPVYAAYRNTLFVVIVLFVSYLGFEFQTLWFKTFPKGFYYSGYAHEGAAWLTVALGLSTIMLSLMFRGAILADPRLPRLRTLCWIWSLENILLAIAVFNRLFIYIGFNGMTRMRVVGMLGVTSVVVGFVLVLWKIARNKGFVWLVRRQLWTVSFAVFLYAVLPVDAFVNRFNVDRILAGDDAPCVQISVHPTSDEGFLCLKPLIDCSNEIIRDGIRAMLAQKLAEIENEAVARQMFGWTDTQFARKELLKQLRGTKSVWQNARILQHRDEVLKEFHDYAYQWY